MAGLVGDRPIAPVVSGYFDHATPAAAAPAAEQSRWPTTQRHAASAGVPTPTAIQRSMDAGTTPATVWSPNLPPVNRSLSSVEEPASPSPPVLPAVAETIAQTIPPELTTKLVVQRADTGEATPAISATTATSPAGTTTLAPSAGPASSTEVDSLVHRLYDPIVRRLKAELQLDRERAGHSLDLRH